MLCSSFSNTFWFVESFWLSIMAFLLVTVALAYLAGLVKLHMVFRAKLRFQFKTNLFHFGLNMILRSCPQKWICQNCYTSIIMWQYKPNSLMLCVFNLRLTGIFLIQLSSRTWCNLNIINTILTTTRLSRQIFAGILLTLLRTNLKELVELEALTSLLAFPSSPHEQKGKSSANFSRRRIEFYIVFTDSKRASHFGYVSVI